MGAQALLARVIDTRTNTRTSVRIDLPIHASDAHAQHRVLPDAFGLREVWALPLITFGPPDDAQAVRDARKKLGAYTAVMAVSGYAVDAFFGDVQGGRPDPMRAVAEAMAVQALALQAWATGPGTAGAFARHGFAAAQIVLPPTGEPMDSEALWAELQSRWLAAGASAAGHRVLLIRGVDAHSGHAGRPWLAQQLRAAGAQVDEVVAYERLAPVWDTATLDAVRAAAHSPAIWVFSSSLAVRHLSHASGLKRVSDWAQARAVATHARIAQAASELGFGVVRIATPEPQAVLRSIESLESDHD